MKDNTHPQPDEKHSAPGRKPILPGVLFAVLMVIGAWLRFSHADWDATNHLHPDERGILFVAETLKPPTRLADFFKPEDSPLNPFRATDGSKRSFAYGHFPLYTTVISQQLLALPCAGSPSICDAVPPDSFLGRVMNVSHQPRFTHLTYIGRALSALFDTLTILAVWLLARELFNRWAGVIAASLACFAVLHIQNAHFGTVDTAAGLFATLTIWMLVRLVKLRRLKDGLLAGVFMGLAIGSKVNTGLLIVPLAVAHIQVHEEEAGKRYSFSARFWLYLLAGGISFALTNPYALLDPVPFFTGITTQAMLVSGRLDWVFARQYSGSLPLVYMLNQQARWLLRLPLTLAVYTGLVWAGIRATWERAQPLLITVIWASLMVVTTGIQFMKFPRYMLPVMPTLFALAGGMFSTLLATSKLRVKRAIALLLAVTTASAGIYALAFINMYNVPHPWVVASEWIYRNLPPGTTIIVEQWDDPLPLDIIVDGMGYQRERVYNTRVIDPFSEPDDIDKLDEMLAQVAEADYIILSSNRAYGVIPRLEDRYPLSSAYYRALFSGELGFRLEDYFRRAPNLLGFNLYDDPFSRAGLDDPRGEENQRAMVIGFADESFTVYDHPMPLVFANVERLPADELKSRIMAQTTE